jgi:hypothetical protein
VEYFCVAKPQKRDLKAVQGAKRLVLQRLVMHFYTVYLQIYLRTPNKVNAPIGISKVHCGRTIRPFSPEKYRATRTNTTPKLTQRIPIKAGNAKFDSALLLCETPPVSG